MSTDLRIKMYNVGFGDCFLIILPTNKTILVDAGFHSQGKGTFSGNDLVEQIIEDLREISDPPRIDVVVATHRHQDHIYAFNSEHWSEVEVGEVWLPWVEDRSNAKAMSLWKRQRRFAQQLAAAIPTFNLNEDDRQSVEFLLWNAGVDPDSLSGLTAAGGWSNAAALDCLHNGFARRDKAQPRFLPASNVFPETFETPALPGVTIHVLGPPRDPDLLEDLNPEADGETYRALALRVARAQEAAGAPILAGPFAEAWEVPETETGFQLESEEVQRMVDLAQGADAVFAAEKLDGMINSTSLVVIIEIQKARLLFAGDAEWGTWKHILENDEACALLRGATFFKVGHHGSHNATSKTLVEKILPRGIPAMISTQEGPGNYRNRIPLSELLQALQERNIHFVRSDKATKPLPSGFQSEPQGNWVELTLEC